MPKINGDKLIRVHIQLYEDDWKKLEAFFGGAMKRSAVVRDIIHDFVQRAAARGEQHGARGAARAERTGENKDAPAS